MTETQTIITAPQLARLKSDENLVIIDLSSRDAYLKAHIPQAIWCDFNRIVATEPPVMGLLPTAESLTATFATLGITPQQHVVVYDNEDGLKAARLLWTLDAVGHKQSALLIGGLHAWQQAGFVTSTKIEVLPASQYAVEFNRHVIAERGYILQQLNNPNVRIIDARSSEEYRGRDVRSTRGGHIPGAINIDWTHTLDADKRPLLRSMDSLRQLYESVNVLPRHEVIVYCQTHRRSAHSYAVLKSLGYTNLKGYPGSWSDWGNQEQTPVETGLSHITIKS